MGYRGPSVGQARAALGDTFMSAQQRKIFGKSLIDQPVIRNKLASSAAALGSVQMYIEQVTYDMANTKGGAVGPRFAGLIALVKHQATRTCWNIADNCVLIVGVRGITRSGMGAKVEGFNNYTTNAAVYGGSEEIMADLAVKQAMTNYPVQSKL